MKRYVFELFIDGEHYLIEGKGDEVGAALENVLVSAVDKHGEPVDPLLIEGEVIFETEKADNGDELPPVIDWVTPGKA